MKRSFIFIAAVLTLCFCVMLFAACEYNAGSTVDGKDTPIDDGPHEIEQTVRYAVTVDDYLTVKSYEYEEGKTVTVTAPDVKNKLFVGWYYQGEKKTERKEYEFVVREDASVRAEYVDAYTVRLDAGEGTVETTEITVGKGMTYVLPVPTRKNYRFVGWTWSNMTITGEDGESLEAFFFDNDVILTARYEEKPKFTVSVSNGEGEREDFVYYQDEEIRINAEDLSEKGKKLVGWYEITIVDGETKETKITDDDELTFTVKGDAEYVAKYVLSYSVILWIDSEVGINDYEGGETAEISLASVPVGKEFLYWFDMDTNETLSYELAFSFEVDRNREIKAVFEYIDYYITYILDDVEEKKEKYRYNEEVDLWIPEAETHKYFGGWSESIRRMPAEDKTLYGKMFWEKHVLTVVDGEGSGEYDYNSEVTLTPKNYRGKKFVEWRIDDDVFTGDENGVYSFRLTKNTVCNGVYEWIDYSVEYKVYGGDWAQEGETYATVSGLHYGQKTDILPSPELSESREGHYTFGGWTKEGVSVEGSLVMPDGNVVIEGVFTVHTHEIEVKNGFFYGTEDKRIVAEWGQALTVAADIPTGKYFVGWFSDGQIVSEEEVFVFNVWGDVVIEGQTGDKKYSVVYMLTDADGSEREYRSFNDCRYGASFPVPEEPRETHKVFGGWSYCGGALPQTVPDVEGQMTVVGSFSWQKYTVTVTNGYLFDGFETTGTFDYNTLVTVRAVYSEANADWYSFLDWFDVDDKAEIRDAEERYEFNLAKNVNLRADFVKTDFKARFFTRTDGGEYAKYGETTFNVDKKLSATVLGEVPAEERTHYDFSGWKLADGTAVPETLSPGDVDIYGEYTVVSYAIRSEYYNEETLDSGAMDEKVAPYGTTVKLVASERTGETFVRWVNAGGSLVSPDKEITVSVEGDRTYRAVYKRMRVGVTVPEGSAVTVKSGEYIKAEEKYVYGSVISITAPTADYVPEGKAFDYWNKNGERYAATERIEAEITEDVVFAVIYSNIVYNVFYHAEGTIVTSEGVVTYYKEDLFDFGDERLNPQTAVFGEGITLNALPSAPEHYQFFGWYRDDGYTQKESDSIGMPSRDVHLYGRYVIDRHNLEVKYITASGDAIDGAEGSGEYDYGTEIALAPGEVTGQHFVKWICGGTEYTDEIYNLTLREDTTVTAVYEYTYYKTTYYTADSVNGVVGASALYYEQTDIKYGDTVTVTASPADDREEFVFGGWTIDGENVGTEFVMPDSDVVVLGVFYSRFNYELNESGNYIVSAVSEYKNNYPDVLTIPSEYDGKAVVGIKEGGFSDIVSTKITVPSSITTVGRMAFSGVRAEEIAVCSVYGGYFGYLFGATDYQNQGSEVPDSLKKIKITGCAVPENAFYGLNKITSVELDGVTAVGNQAFYNCSSVSSLTIPETVSTIGDGAFYGMQSCAELNYYASATLGGNAFGYFAYKSSGATVTFGGAATAVPASAFEASANIASLVLSEGVSEVGARAFYGVTALKNVSFPSTLISIGEYAFYRVSIETLTIPETVASIGAQAFGETTSLTTINYGAVSASASDAFVSAGSTENTVTLYIGEGVENIQNGAFRNSNINTVEFAENSSLVSVGAEAFYSSALTGISLPEGATTIGSNAFGGANITEVVVPSTVTTIGEGAFGDCPKLSSVIYGATASDGYSAYTTVFADSGTESGITVTVKSNVSVVPSYMFGGAEKERMHIIGVRFEQNSVCTAIGEYAFANNPISTLEIGKEVLSVGRYAFYGIDATETILPYVTENIGAYAFGNAVNLTINCEAKAPYSGWHEKWADGVAAINYGYGETVGDDYNFVISGDKAYLTAYTGSATEVVLPETVTNGSETFPVRGFGQIFAGKNIASFTSVQPMSRIADYAFADCESLVSVTIGGTPVFGNGTFSGCISLSGVAVDFGARVPDYTFFGCSSLSSFDLSAAEIIGREAFRNSGITAVDLSSLQTLGYAVFAGCSSLAEFSAGNESFDVSTGALIDTARFAVVAYPLARAASDYVLPQGTLVVDDFAFCGATSLASVTLNASLSSIGKSAFADCEILTDVVYNAINVSALTAEDKPFNNSGISGMTATIGASVLSIPSYLFFGDDNAVNVTALVFEEASSCANIGEYAFRNNRISELTVPSSVVSIGNYAFFGGLATVLNYNAISVNEVSNDTFTLGENAVVNVGDGVTTIPSNFLYSEAGCKATVLNLPSDTLSDGYTIGENAFRATGFSEIVIGEKVSDVGHRAFAGITALTKVTISSPNDFTGRNVFSGSGDSATEYIFGINVPAYIFDGETEKTVTFDNTVKIGEGAFRSVPLASIDLPDTIETIGARAFENTVLTSITIPAAVTSIGNYAFYGINNLTTVNYNAVRALDMDMNNNVYSASGADITVNIGSGVTRIPQFAFSSTGEEFGRIKTVNLSESITEVGGYAFAYLTEAAFVGSLSNVTTLEEGAFYSCKGLVSVSLGVVATLDSYAFYGCVNMTSFTANASGSGYNLGSSVFEDCSSLQTAALGKAVSAGEKAFKNCLNLVQVTGLADSGLRLGAEAFYGCRRLTTVDVSSLTTIADRLFYGCAALDVSIPDGVLSIGEEAFFECTTLSSVNIGEKVVSIGKRAFYGCTNATAITYSVPNLVGEGGKNVSLSGYELFGNVGADTAGATVTIGAKTVRVPDYAFVASGTATPKIISVEYAARTGATLVIGAYAFAGLPLTAIEVPYFVTEVADSAFKDCADATVLTLGNGEQNALKYIGKYAFANLKSLTYMYHNATALYDKLFVGNQSADYTGFNVFADSGIADGFDLYIDKDVAEIHASMFDNVNAEPNARIRDVIIESESVLKKIGDKAFRLNATMRSINLPASVEIIGSDAFYLTSNLSSAGDMNGLVEIGDGAFNGTALTSVVLGEKLTSVGNAALYNLTALTSITINCKDLGIANGASDVLFANAGSATTGIEVVVSATATYVPAVFGGSSEEEVPNVNSVGFLSGAAALTVADNAFAPIADASFSNVEGRDLNAGARAFYGVSSNFVASFNNIDGVVGEEAFKDSGITKILVNEGTKIDIRRSAFENCASLLTVEFSTAGTEMSKYVNKGVSSSVYPNIDGGNGWLVDSNPQYIFRVIGDSAFKDCVSFNFTTVYPQPTDIGAYAFSGCTSLTDIFNFDGTYSYADVFYPDDGTEDPAPVFMQGTFKGAEEVISIGNYAFENAPIARVHIRNDAAVASIHDAYPGVRYLYWIYEGTELRINAAAELAANWQGGWAGTVTVTVLQEPSA